MPKSLSLPLWMHKHNEPNVPKTTTPSKPYSRIEKVEDDYISSQFNRQYIATECEQLLDYLDKSNEEFVISLDLDWPSRFSAELAKASTIHLCTGINTCCQFMVKHLTSLPFAFISLLKHPNIRLIGNNIVNDLLKLRRDFKLDLKPVISSNLILTNLEPPHLSCQHEWILHSVSSVDETGFTHNAPPNRHEAEVLSFKGQINYCTDFVNCAAASEKLLNIANTKEPFVIGFDLEWPFSTKTGSGKVALMQLCPNESVCYLFHVSEFKILPKALCVLLRHKNVRLTGLNIKNDLRKLGKDFKIDVASIIENNLIELSTYANKQLNCSHRWSLDRLVLNQFNKLLLKTPSVRVSNWANKLSEEQLLYAATDAYASLICYEQLNKIQM